MEAQRSACPAGTARHSRGQGIAGARSDWRQCSGGIPTVGAASSFVDKAAYLDGVRTLCNWICFA